MFKVNDRNTGTRCEMLKVNNKDIRTTQRRTGVFIVNFEHNSHLALAFLLLTMSRKMPAELPAKLGGESLDHVI